MIRGRELWFLQNADSEMRQLLSSRTTVITRSEMRIALSEAMRRLGLEITRWQVGDVDLYLRSIDYDKINNDLTIAKAIWLIRAKLKLTLQTLANFAECHKAVPMLSYVPPPKLTTVGKCATMWLRNFSEDLESLTISNYPLLEIINAEALLYLCNGNVELYLSLASAIVEELYTELATTDFGYMESVENRSVFSQTSRAKTNHNLVNDLVAIGASACEFVQDIRFLEHRHELEETQATIVETNPPIARSELVLSLVKYLGSLPTITWQDATIHYLEQDSGHYNYLLDAFCVADAILDLCIGIVNNLWVNQKIITMHITMEPSVFTESIIEKALEKGAKRPEMCRRIHEHCLRISQKIQEDGISADDIRRQMIVAIGYDHAIPLDVQEATEILGQSLERMIRHCIVQVTEYLSELKFILQYSDKAY